MRRKITCFVSNLLKATKMNCTTCQKHLEAYLDGTISPDLKIQVDAHLAACKACAEWYARWTVVEQVMNEEKSTSPNPFLATRIMVQLEEMQSKTYVPAYGFAKQSVFRPVTVVFIVGVAISLGVLLGNLYRPLQVRPTQSTELLYLDDSAIEPISFYEAK